MKNIPIASTGDAKKSSILAEYTLVCKNELASGKLPDLTTA
jgi:hypothetical protein